MWRSLLVPKREEDERPEKGSMKRSMVPGSVRIGPTRKVSSEPHPLRAGDSIDDTSLRPRNLTPLVLDCGAHRAIRE